jgi:ParB/RepB/Spo0J family partition protein
MSKKNIALGISALINNKNLIQEENTQGRNVMALLRDNETKEPANNPSNVSSHSLLNERNIQDLNIKESRPVYSVPLEIIRIREGDNVRKEYGDIEELAELLWAQGLLFPLTLELEKLPTGEIIPYLWDGHRRFQSYAWLKEDGRIVEYVDCFIRDKNTTAVDRIKFMYTSQKNKQLEPLEAAGAFNRLNKDEGLSAEKIAKEIGVSEKFIRDMLIIANESDEIKQLIKEKKVLYTAVVDLKRTEPDAEKRLQIILDKIQDKGNFTTTDVKVLKIKKQKELKDITAIDPHLQESGKAILGPVLWEFGNLILEVKKGEIGPKEINRKIGILQEKPNNPFSVYKKLELFKDHLSLFFGNEIQEIFKIIIQFQYGEIEEVDLLRIADELKLKKDENQ